MESNTTAIPDMYRNFRECVEAGDTIKVKELLEKGVAVGESLLFLATCKGHTEIVTMLLSARANPHFSMGGETPLHIASGRGHAEIVRALIRAGACVDTPNMRGNTPLQYALSGTSNIEIIAMLLDAGVDVDSVVGEREKQTPIHIAVIVALHTGNIEAVKLVLARGADVTIKNAHGETLLDVIDDYVDDRVRKQIKQMLWDHLNPDPC